MSDAIVKAFTITGNTSREDIGSTSESEAIDGFDDTNVTLDRQLRIYNAGPNRAFIAKGTSTVVAVEPTDGTPADGMPIDPGVIEIIGFKAGETHVAAICASGETATLYYTPGVGV
tara:strand:+ start:9812 stop:10159 length:348 start_codon:yes stop_codon:yes gene_type:complete